MSGKIVRNNGGSTRVVAISQGGTGATNRTGALNNLDAVPASLSAKPLGTVPLDANGQASPEDLGLSVAGQPSIVGPQEIAFGSKVNYVITNYDSFTSYSISPIAGSVRLVDDVLEYTAPDAKDGFTKGGFIIAGRRYEISLSEAKISKPKITYPTEGASLATIGASVLITCAAFAVSGGTAVKSGELQGKGTTTLTVGQASSNPRTIRYVGRGGPGYRVGGVGIAGVEGYVQNSAGKRSVFPAGIGGAAALTSVDGGDFTEGMTVTFDIPNKAEAKYFIYESSAALLGMEWEVSSSPDFTTTIVKTGVVSNFNSGLPTNFAMQTGNRYYVRVRHHATNGTSSEWSDPLSFYYQQSAAANVFKTVRGEFNFLDHVLSYGTDTAQIQASLDGLSFVKGYGRGRATDGIGANWNVGNIVSPLAVAVTGQIKPSQIKMVNDNDPENVLIVEAQDSGTLRAVSSQYREVGYSRYYGPSAPSYSGLVLADYAKVPFSGTIGFPEPVASGQTRTKAIPQVLAKEVGISTDRMRAYVATALESMTMISSRTGLDQVFKAQEWIDPTTFASKEYAPIYFNMASMLEFSPVNQTNWKDHDASSYLYAQRINTMLNRRVPNGARDEPRTNPALHVGGSGIVDETVVLVPRSSWRRTLDETGKEVTGQSGADVVITTHLRNGGDPVFDKIHNTMTDYLLNDLTGCVDGIRVANGQWVSAMSSDALLLAVANVKDYGGRGSIAVYKRRSNPINAQNVVGTLNYVSHTVGTATPGAQSGWPATLPFNGVGLDAIPSYMRANTQSVVSGVTTSVAKSYKLVKLEFSAGEVAPVMNFRVKATYSIEEGNYITDPAADGTSTNTFYVYEGAITINSPTAGHGSPVWVLWELISVIPGDKAGMSGLGQQLAISRTGTLVAGYQDTTTVNTVRYRVYDLGSYSADSIASQKQAIRPPSDTWTITNASSGITVSAVLYSVNDAGFVTDLNTAVAGLGRSIRYKNGATAGVMSLSSVSVNNGVMSVTYTDASNGKTATYQNSIASNDGRTAQAFKLVATVSPTYSDANCVAVAGTGNRIFIGKAGKVTIVDR